MSNKFSQLYSEVGEHVSLKHCSNRCAMGQVSRRHGQGPVCTVTVLTPQSAKQWFQHPSLRGSSLAPLSTVFLSFSTCSAAAFCSDFCPSGQRTPGKQSPL